MEHHIEHGPSFAWLRVILEPGDEVQGEAGSMVRQGPDVVMTTHLNAPKRASIFTTLWALIVAFMRKFLGGETIFINRFTSTRRQELVLAPSLSGHIIHHQMHGGRTVFVQTGSYLASTGSIDTKIRFGGLRSLFGGEGLVLLECTGTGDLWVNSYGGVIPIEVNGNFTVDTGHIVAFEGELDFKVKSIGGVKSFLFSGEGLVCRFEGRGTVYVQSRNLGALVSWLSPLLPG
jgi:uncharacterized protein (TIGR00266 family)